MEFGKRIMAAFLIASVFTVITSGCSTEPESPKESSKAEASSSVASEISKDTSEDTSDSQESLNSEKEIVESSAESSLESIEDEDDVIVGYEKNEEYNYTVYKSHVEILKYIGSDTKISIPNELSGLPVTVVGDKKTDGNNVFPNQIISVEIPDTVTTIGKSAFKNSGVISVTIPDSVTVIDEQAFYECANLKKVKLPMNLEVVGDSAFYGCSNESIFDDKLILPESLKELGNGAFCASGVKEVVIPDQLNSIPDYCFENCQNLTDIKLGNGIKTIGAKAFMNAVSLKKIDFPENLEEINVGAFGQCSLESLELPDNVKIANLAFSFNVFKEITIPKGTSYTVNNIEQYCQFQYCKNLEKVTVNSEFVAAGMFQDCDNLTDVYLSKDVVSIGGNAFAKTGNTVMNIHIPDNVEVIEKFHQVTWEKSYVIYGKKGSEAEKYATSNGIKFVEE